MMPTPARSEIAASGSALASLIGRGSAQFLAFLHPFEPHSRIEGEIPAGWTVADVLREAKLANDTPAYAGILVRVNGRTVRPEQYGSRVLAAGDRMIARAMPREAFTIAAILGWIASAAASVGSGVVAGGAAALGVGGVSLGAGIGAGVGALSLAGFAIGYAAVLVGGGYLLSLAARAMIGSPDSSGTGSSSSKRVSPTASGAGNQLLPDQPVFITCGDVRVHSAPHVAVPFQPGYVGGRDSDPAIRELLAVGGDCIISDIRLGKVDIGMLDIRHTVFRNQQTVNFPTAEVKHPGISLRDEWRPANDPAPWEVMSTTGEVDELSLIFLNQSGLYRSKESADTKEWQISLDIEYRVVGSGSAWAGFFGRDAAGNSAQWRVPFVVALQVGGDYRFHLNGQTREPFFWYLHRKVLREVYEVRFRLRPNTHFFHADGTNDLGKKITSSMWPDDRRSGQRGGSNTLFLATDPLLVQFMGLRNEPAVSGFAPGLSGIDLELIDQTTKSDESSRISFRSRNQIPEIANNARTAPTTTSNPVAWVLYLLTGPMAGDTAQPDSKIDFLSFQAAFDYCNESVPTINGGVELRHKIDAVLDRGIGRLEQCQDILRNFRMRLIRMDGRYHIVIDQKRTAPRMLLAETDIIEMESDRSWAIIPDMLRVEFFNGERDGEKDELHVYNDAPAVAGVLPNGGYSSITSNKGGTSGVSVTVTRSGDYALIALSTGWAGVPEEGWICIRWPGGTPWSDARLFLIDNISSDLLTLTVIDKDAVITTGTRLGTFDTTAAERIESLSLPYSQRPSECFREARYFLAQGRSRPEIYKIHVGLEWMGIAQGDMIEVSSSVPVFGRGSGRVLAIQGPANAATAIQMDEEFDLEGLAFPVIKLVSWDGSSIVVNRFDLNAADTDTLRTSAEDDRWLVFEDAQDLTAIGVVIGGGNGSVGAFGERTFETKELVVQWIQMGEDYSATLTCVDHAPEMFDAILDQEPVPRFNSGIIETGIGERARPSMPQLSASVYGPSTPMTSITASDAAANEQTFTRATGSWIDEGYTDAMKVDVSGFATAANNKARAYINSVSATDLVVIASTGAGDPEAGTGDERAHGLIGTRARQLGITRAATGLQKLDVAPQGGGVVHLNGPTGAGVFAGFRSTGWCELLDVAGAGNSGWWLVTSKPSDDRLVLSDPGDVMVASTGSGSERCHQSQVYPGTGVFSSEGFSVGDRIALSGFEQAIAQDIFTVRGVDATGLYLDDPFGRLVTEAGSGDEMATVMTVPVAYQLVDNLSADGLELEVTVPLRPGTKSIVTVDDVECRYRLRETSGRVAGGWINAGVIPAGAVSATFGPIPAEMDWDFAARAISRNKTASDWVCLTGNGRRDRPAAPLHLQVHSDAVAMATGQRFALRVEWASPDTETHNYVLRWKLRAVDGWSSQVLYAKTEALIADATIGTYDLELYTLDTSGQPSDAARVVYDFDPDRDFEDTVVTNLRVLNHPEAALVGDPRLQWTGPDLLLGWVEPDFSGEYIPDETAGMSSGLSPLVRGFELQVFDPATGSELRREIGYRSREYRYTRAMNADDQARTFARGPWRQIGLRVRMHSVTNRTSAWAMIACENPRPILPDSVTLTSSPGDATKSLDAVVHAVIDQGSSKADADFRSFGVWASTTNGFTPSPSNFKGLTPVGDNRISFPAPSGATVYVRAGGLDDFHPLPELIAQPAVDVALLAQQSVLTYDSASLPIDTDGIVPGAVTDMAYWSADNFAGGFPHALSVAAKGGPVLVNGFISGTRQAGPGTSSIAATITRRCTFDSILFKTGGITYTQTGRGAVSAPLLAGDALYIGNIYKFGASPHFLKFVIVSPISIGIPSVIVVEYWNGTAWVSVPNLTDSSNSLNALPGTHSMEWTVPSDWQASVDGTVGPYYWVRIRQTGTPDGGPNPALLDLNADGNLDAGRFGQSSNQPETTFLCAAMSFAITEGTKAIETLTMSFKNVSEFEFSARGYFSVHAGKR